MPRLKDQLVKIDPEALKLSSKPRSMHLSDNQVISTHTSVKRASLATTQTCLLCHSRLNFPQHGSLKSTNRFSTLLRTSFKQYLVRSSSSHHSSYHWIASLGKISTPLARLQTLSHLLPTIWPTKFQHSPNLVAILVRTQARCHTLCSNNGRIPTL